MKSGRVFVSVTVVTALILTALSSLEAFAQGPTKVQAISNAVVHAPTHFDISPPLGEMVLENPSPGLGPVVHPVMRTNLHVLIYDRVLSGERIVRVGDVARLTQVPELPITDSSWIGNYTCSPRLSPSGPAHAAAGPLTGTADYAPTMRQLPGRGAWVTAKQSPKGESE